MLSTASKSKSLLFWLALISSKIFQTMSLGLKSPYYTLPGFPGESLN